MNDFLDCYINGTTSDSLRPRSGQMIPDDSGSP